MGILGDIIGGITGYKAARDAKKSADADRALLQQQMQRLSGVQFNPFSVLTPGGAGVTYGGGAAPAPAPVQQAAPARRSGFASSTGGARKAGGAGFSRQQAAPQPAYQPGRGGGVGPFANLQLGEFNPLYQLLGQAAPRLAGQGIGQMGAATANMPFAESQRLAQMLSGQAAGQAAGLGMTGFQRGLQSQLFGGASQFAQEASRGFGDIQAQTLATLRQQAAPFEERAFSGLQENLFRTGRGGTTGGSLQTEAFARGLGQADLQRQLSATQLGMDLRGQAGNLAQGFAGTGGNLAGLESDLLSGAFSRFQNTAGLAADLNQMQFGRGQDLFGTGMDALTGQQSILDSIIGMGQFGADLGRLRASTDIQAAGGSGNIAAAATGIPSGRDVQAAFLSQLSGNLGGMQPLLGRVGDAATSLWNKYSPFGGQQQGTPASDFTQSGMDTFNKVGYNPFAGQFGVY